jgi:hypothetical protein
MGVAVDLGYRLSVHLAPRGGTAIEAARIAVLIAAGAGLTAAGLHLARVEEGRQLFRRLLRRESRK